MRVRLAVAWLTIRPMRLRFLLCQACLPTPPKGGEGSILFQTILKGSQTGMALTNTAWEGCSKSPWPEDTLAGTPVSRPLSLFVNRHWSLGNS